MSGAWNEVFRDLPLILHGQDATPVPEPEAHRSAASAASTAHASKEQPTGAKLLADDVAHVPVADDVTGDALRQVQSGPREEMLPGISASSFAGYS